MRQRCGVYVAQDVLVATLAGGYVSTRQKLATGRARVRRTPSSRLALEPQTRGVSVPSKDAGVPKGNTVKCTRYHHSEEEVHPARHLPWL
jgi:hypothetical protein